MTEEKKRDPIEIEISGQEAFVNPTPEELWRMAMKQLLKLAIDELDARPIEMFHDIRLTLTITEIPWVNES